MKLSDLTKPISLDFTAIVEPELLQHPPIPFVLTRYNPRTILGYVWWDEVRRETYRRNKWSCQACGVTPDQGDLEAHERYDYDTHKFIATYIGTVPLCKQCHQYIHANTLPIRRVLGKYLPYKSTNEILVHGIKVLLQADLKVPKFKAQLVKGVNIPTDRQYLDPVWALHGDQRWKLSLKMLELRRQDLRRKYQGDMKVLL